MIGSVLLAGFGDGPSATTAGPSPERQVFLMAVVLGYALLELPPGFVSSSWRWGVGIAMTGVLVGLVFGEMQHCVPGFVVERLAAAVAASYTGPWFKVNGR